MSTGGFSCARGVSGILSRTVQHDAIGSLRKIVIFCQSLCCEGDEEIERVEDTAALAAFGIRGQRVQWRSLRRGPRALLFTGFQGRG